MGRKYFCFNEKQLEKLISAIKKHKHEYSNKKNKDENKIEDQKIDDEIQEDGLNNNNDSGTTNNNDQKNIVVEDIILIIAILILGLIVGTLGYYCFAKFGWLDSFYNAALIYSGMGPPQDVDTCSGKLFASIYAIISGLIIISIIAIIISKII